MTAIYGGLYKTSLKLILASSFFLFFLIFSPVAADELLNIANTYTAKDADIENGDIVARSENNLKEVERSKKAYDEKLVGVVFNQATVVYRIEGMGIAVVENGEVKTKVTTLNGPINTGDAVTTSSIAGKGQKADSTAGQILGIALEGLTDENSTELIYDSKPIREGKILVLVRVGTGISSDAGIISRLVDQLSLLILRNTQTPIGAETFLRYLSAALLAAVIIFVSFISFGRNIAKGIEAIGRNPLAKTQIQAMIIFNVVLIAIISIGGIILSLAIIRF